MHRLRTFHRTAFFFCLLAGVALGQTIAVVKTPPLGTAVALTKPSGNPALIQFGEVLLRARQLSRDSSVSCVSCHVADLGFSGATPTGVGIGGVEGRRRAPPLFNLKSMTALMWDGRARGLADQPRFPLECRKEMDVDWPAALRAVSRFPEAHPFLNADGLVDRETVISALAAYLGTLMTGSSSFDRYYYLGETMAISEEAKEGLRIFVRKARCETCHILDGHGAPLTDGNFHSIGIGWENNKYKDNGRAEFTGLASDEGKFKTPTLRNVTQRRYFMHDGSITSLRSVIEYYNRGGNSSAHNFDSRISRLYLTEIEINELITFLRTLDSPTVSYRP